MKGKSAMKAYEDLKQKYNELKQQYYDKIRSLSDAIHSKEALIQEKSIAYETAENEEKEKIISSINILKTETKVLQAQINAHDESIQCLNRNAEIKELVHAVENEYYSELTRMRNEMASDVAKLNEMIPMLNALNEKYSLYAKYTASLNDEVHKTGKYYLDDGSRLMGYSKEKFVNPNYMSPTGYVKFPELNHPEGIYQFGRDVVSLLHKYGLDYIQK